MSELNASAADSFITAISNGAGEAASVFSRTFDTTVAFEPGIGGKFDLTALKERFSVPGLAMTLLTEGKAILVLLPANTGLIPDWCENPDATGKSKLSTFAQELGLNIVPDDFFPEDFQSEMVENLAEAAENGKIGDDPGFVELIIDQSGNKTTAMIIWPIEDREAVFKSSASVASVAEPVAAPETELKTPKMFGVGAPSFGDGFTPFGSDPSFDDEQKRLSTDELPGFSRSVLKVKIPVAAVLARARRQIKAILELGIGSVIQFDKSCDEPLELEIDRTIIALGEAVKVGDKFGVRLSTVLLPKERFRTVVVRREGEYKRRERRPPQIIGKAPIKSLE